MKKSNILSIVLALIAVAAVIFGIVTNGKKADLQKQVDELTASVTAAKQEAADAVKNAEEEIAKVKEEAEKSIEEAIAKFKEEAEKPAKEVMNHEQFMAAELETEVTVETYVQAKQSWWDNKGTIYTQAEDGAYFLYNMPMTQEEYDQLVPGTKIRVTGFKAEWSGEVEIIDSKFEILEADPFIATPVDVTDLLAADTLIDHQNELVAVKGVTVEAYDETGAAFAYKNPTEKTDDLYFKVSKDGQTYEFCVEFYLTGKDTEVYQAVEALNVGDVIDLEGFLYWYNGANLQATKLTKAE